MSSKLANILNHRDLSETLKIAGTALNSDYVLDYAIEAWAFAFVSMLRYTFYFGKSRILGNIHALTR